MMWLEWVVGAATGLLSGCGIGGGTLLLLYLTAVVGVPQRLAAGVNLLYFLCCTPTALIAHVRHRLVDGRAFCFAALAGVVTAGLAAFGATVIDTDWLRRGFGVLLLYIGFKSLFGRPKKRRRGFKKSP